MAQARFSVVLSGEINLTETSALGKCKLWAIMIMSFDYYDGAYNIRIDKNKGVGRLAWPPVVLVRDVESYESLTH